MQLPNLTRGVVDGHVRRSLRAQENDEEDRTARGKAPGNQNEAAASGKVRAIKGLHAMRATTDAGGGCGAGFVGGAGATPLQGRLVSVGSNPSMR